MEEKGGQRPQDMKEQWIKYKVHFFKLQFSCFAVEALKNDLLGKMYFF
jgi:hypothetical protein